MFINGCWEDCFEDFVNLPQISISRPKRPQTAVALAVLATIIEKFDTATIKGPVTNQMPFNISN